MLTVSGRWLNTRIFRHSVVIVAGLDITLTVVAAVWVMLPQLLRFRHRRPPYLPLYHVFRRYAGGTERSLADGR
ncbi:hypothetical protein LINGRAHAP2_LOCUS32299 [Linum grandiflorum]